MKRFFVLIILGLGTATAVMASVHAGGFFAPGALKLPYQKGQSFIVVQGYNSPPTHINKDADAIDFSQNGCDAYGKIAVAAAPGTVELAEENGYNGGYGTQVLVDLGAHIVARYAHLIPGTIPFGVGARVAQGEPIGAIGDTGLVAGFACPTHPGTHIHFALYYQNSDASFSAFLPEPISGYTNIIQGRWYLSDNELGAAEPTSASSAPSLSAIIGDSVPGNISPETSTPTTTSLSVAALSGSGGVSAVPASPAIVVPNSTVTSTATSDSESSTPSSSLVEATSSEFSFQPSSSFNSSTLAIDLSWQAVADTSTVYEIFKNDAAASSSVLLATTTAASYSYVLTTDDFGSSLQFTVASTLPFALASVSVSLPDWWTTIQPIANTNSNPSWYSDNWYDLGTGFYGLIRSLTLKGFIDNSNYLASHLWLDEYLDPGYSQLNQTFMISDNAPFTNGLQAITISGLAIPLQPDKYYRLRTYQDEQNRSVVLAGTSATGTAMWDEFISGTGGVSHTYSFYPYLAAIMIPNYPPLEPPNAPASMAILFDPLNSILNFSWAATTDPDTTSSLLAYQFAVSTSTTPDPGAWRSAGKNLSASAPVVFGNSYTVGVRAIDDLGNIGSAVIEPWNFPSGYAPLPQQLDHSVTLPGGAQGIKFLATTTITAIDLWTMAQAGDASCCNQSFVSLHADASGTVGAEIAETDPVTLGRFSGDAEREYDFVSPVVLSPGYYWFQFSIGPAGNTNETDPMGSLGDSYPDGAWSSAPGQDAYFRIEQANGP